MSLRLWLNVSAVFGMGILVSYMAGKEILEAKKAETKVSYVDRLVKLDLRYISRDREDNFSNFGMSEKMIRTANKRLKVYDKQRKKIIQLLKDAIEEDPEAVERCFCNKDDHRSRYWAVQFLMSKDGNKAPEVLSLKKVSSLEFQDWSDAIAIGFLYQTLELRADPQTDATIMWAGAVLTGQTESIRNRDFPWGDGANWSWNDLVKSNKGIDIKIADYIAMMHVFTEVATDSSEAICFSE